MIKDNSPEFTSGPPRINVVAKPLARKDDDQQNKFLWPTLLSSLRRIWRIALPLGLCLGAAAAFLGWKLFIPSYSASAFLRINSNNRPLIFKTADEISQGENFNLYKSTQQQLLTTPFVLNTALRDPKVAALEEIAEREDPIGWLRDSIKVVFPGQGEIMQVTVETASPTNCVLIVNAVVDAFMQEVVMSDRSERLKRLDTLEKVFSERTNQVRSKRVELKNLATTLGTSDTNSLTVAQQNALQQFGKMQEKLSDVQFAIMQNEGEIKIAEELVQRQKEVNGAQEAEGSSMGEDEASRQVAERTAEVINLEEQIAVAQAKLNGMGKVFGPSHFNVLKAKEDLDIKREMLTQRKAEAKMRAQVSADKEDDQSRGLRESGGGVYDLLGLTSKAQVLANQEKILTEKVERLADETRQLGRSSIDVELMRSEISGLENVLRTVGDEIERTSVELKTSSRVRVLSTAIEASLPNTMKRLTVATCSGMLGLLAPFGLIGLWDLTRGRVNNVEGACHSLSLPTIGRIPLVSGNPLMRRDLESQLDIEPVEAEMDEAIDGLASMILYSSQIDKRQVFMISSAMPGEGKSTVSCQLAQSLARAGKSVALVDFDLRRPSIHRYLDLSLEPGLAQSLFGDLAFEETVQKTEVENLSVMTAGDWEGNLQERCTAGAVTELFQYLRSSFDLVVVDSSPVLPVHDARVIGKFTDGVILILVRDKSRLLASAQACEILRSFGANLLGTVMIGASAYPGTYSGYSGYSGYATYGKRNKSRRLKDTKSAKS